MDCIALQWSPYSNPVIGAKISFENKYLIKQINYGDILELGKRWGINCVYEITNENATLQIC